MNGSLTLSSRDAARRQGLPHFVDASGLPCARPLGLADPGPRRTARWAAVLAGVLCIVAPAAAQMPPADAAPAAPATPLPDDPLVRALMQTNPREPHEIVSAALTLDDLGAPDVGQALMARWLATGPDAATLADLADRFGSGTMLRLGRAPGLQPAGQQLSDAALSAAHQRDNDPQWIVGQIEKLTRGKPRERAAARAALRRGGATAAAALIGALADPDREAEAPAIRGALAAGDQRFVPPLAAALEADDPALAATALAILAVIEGFDAPHWLDQLRAADPNSPAAEQAGALLQHRFNRSPQPAAAARRLRQLAEDHLSGRVSEPLDENGAVLVWSWDERSRAPVAEPMSAPEAARHWALKHLKAAATLAPDDDSIRRLRASLLLAQTTTDPPSDSVSAEVAALDAADVEAVLEAAMAEGDVATACGAARRLGAMGPSDGMFLARAPSPCPLVKALKSPHPLLRSAALEAVLRLNPQGDYPGSSYVVDALVYFARARGTPRAIVAHRSVAEGQRLAGLLSQLGYEPEVTLDAAALARRAADSPDVALIVLDADFLRPSARGAIDLLRVDTTTSLLPLALVATAGSYDRATRLARPDPRTYVLVSPTDVEQLGQQLSAIHPGLAQPAMHGEALRLAHASLESIGRTLGLSRPRAPALVGALYDALREPRLAAQAARVLSRVPTREAQRELAAAAARVSLPAEARQAAAEAFAANVAAGGVRLTPDEVLAQYEVYNTTRREDDDSRQMMGRVLDAMELAAAYAADDERTRSGDSPGG